ncbi:hypothetical protein C8J56DRAFT_888805 [Mycena floridula]|nr:hypothetical protein C8J56DRAFT_888805 [Mycena floridula]
MSSITNLAVTRTNQNVAFQVTPFYLGREILAPNQTPSPASGVASYVDATIGHPDLKAPQPVTESAEAVAGFDSEQSTDLISWFSKESIVLADIQTSASWDPDNCAPVLFDLMTHTLYQNTGARDFRTEGIEGFIEQHQCVPQCSYFGLTPVREDEEVETEKAEARSKKKGVKQQDTNLAFVSIITLLAPTPTLCLGWSRRLNRPRQSQTELDPGWSMSLQNAVKLRPYYSCCSPEYDNFLSKCDRIIENQQKWRLCQAGIEKQVLALFECGAVAELLTLAIFTG